MYGIAARGRARNCKLARQKTEMTMTDSLSVG
jgi:hypothetical protein